MAKTDPQFEAIPSDAEISNAATYRPIEDVAADLGLDAVVLVLEPLSEHGFDDLPVCISKVPSSLSDDPTAFGVFEMGADGSRLYPAAGPGFVVALTGDVMTKPGLPAEPAAKALDAGPDGTITGL